MAEQHSHNWSDWKEQLWYTSEGRLRAKFRTCTGCTVVEAQSIERDARPAVLQPTIGVFAGLFDQDGGVLAKQIETGRFAGEWDAPGGGIDAQRASKRSDERIFFEELARHVDGEVGIYLIPSLTWKILLPAILSGGGDWAFPVVVGPTTVHPTKGITQFLSPEGLEKLARGAEGARILSGWGKRMHRIFLRLLEHSSNPVYNEQATRSLKEVYQSMAW